MKNHLKTRWLALLLCAVTVLSASCASRNEIAEKDTTESIAVTETESEKVTEAESDQPANGAEAIATKTIKLYRTADDVRDISAAHYESRPEILLMDTETICQVFIDNVLLAKGYEYTYEETDTTLTITRSNGAYCALDFVEDTLTFDNFDMFNAYGYGNMADALEYRYIDAEGNSCYFTRTDSVAIAGAPVCVDLAERDIPLDIYEGKKYIPFQTFNDIFLTPLYFNFAYNSRDLFEVSYGAVDASVMDEYYSIERTDRSETLIEYTTNELCLLLDLFYGLQDEHRVTDGFENYIKNAGLWEDLTSPDANKSCNALWSLTAGYLADKHSGLNLASPYAGASEVTGDVICDPTFLYFFDYCDEIVAARAEIMPDGVEGYLEVDNTAYVTFDAFTLSRDRVTGYNENATDTSDTMGLIIYAHSQITRENSPIENVVLDLSCNTGGEADASVYVIGWMLGYCNLHLINPNTNSFATAGYKVDVNLDGVFDEKDTIADKNLYCVISPSSFSAGNHVASMLKESGKVTLLGGTSGGGACVVQFASMADGSIFQFSSPHMWAVVTNGSYYGIDRGVEPHYYFGKFESYFDREALTEYINGLK